jgi:hypothetical protein
MDHLGMVVMGQQQLLLLVPLLLFLVFLLLLLLLQLVMMVTPLLMPARHLSPLLLTTMPPLMGTQDWGHLNLYLPVLLPLLRFPCLLQLLLVAEVPAVMVLAPLHLRTYLLLQSQLALEERSHLLLDLHELPDVIAMRVMMKVVVVVVVGLVLLPPHCLLLPQSMAKRLMATPFDHLLPMMKCRLPLCCHVCLRWSLQAPQPLRQRSHAASHERVSHNLVGS